MPSLHSKQSSATENSMPDTLILDDSVDEAGQRMIDAIEVDEIDTDLYRSREMWHPNGSRGAYGGQLMGQAVRSASYTVSKDFLAHSLHTYFVLPGNAEIPVMYHVDRVRDGRSFAMRTVTAKQRGNVVLVMMISFAKRDENAISLEHQTSMPPLPRPEDLMTHRERLEKLANDERLPIAYRQRLGTVLDDILPVEFRDFHVDTAEDFLAGTKPATEEGGRWFRTRGKLNDDPHIHACVIAYATDSGFLMTSVRANGVSPGRQIGMMASLDHNIRFHAHVRTDQWLAHYMHSPRSNDGRGTCYGRVYTADGTLVATTSQEGIIRLSKSAQEHRRNGKRATSSAPPPQQGSLSVSKAKL